MKKFLFITLILFSYVANSQGILASEYPITKNVNWRFMNNDTVTFNQITLQDKGRWLPNGQLDYIAGVGPYTWPTSLSGTGTRYWTIDAATKVITYAALTGGSITGLYDKQLVFANASGNPDQDDNLYWDSTSLNNNLYLTNTNTYFGVFPETNLDLDCDFGKVNVWLRGANSSIINFDGPHDDYQVKTAAFGSQNDFSIVGDNGTHLSLTNQGTRFRTSLHSTLFLQDLTLGGDTIAMPDLDGTGTILKIDGSGFVTKGTVVASNISGLTDKYLMIGDPSGNAQQSIFFQCDPATGRMFSGGGLDVGNISALYDIHASADAQVEIVADASSGQKVFIGGRAFTGTIASPAATGANDLMVEFGAGGYGTSAFTASSTAMMRFYSTEAFTNTANGSQIRWYVTANGSAIQTRAMTLDHNARLGIGVNSPGYLLDVNGDVNIATGSNYKINGSNITTTNVAEGSNLYHTSERTDDRVDALITATGALTKTYNDAGDAMTLNAKGFTLTIIGVQGTVTDGQTYYSGAMTQGAGTTADVNRMYIPIDCTLKAVYGFCVNTTPSTAETSTVYIRKNNTTDATISSAVVHNASQTTFNATGLSTTYVAGDYIEAKELMPTFVTNPANIRWTFILYFE